MKVNNLFPYLFGVLFFHTSSMKAEKFFASTFQTYYISQHIIAVHNTVPVIVISIPAIVSTIIPVVKTCLVAGATFFGIHLAKKSHSTRKTEDINFSSSSSYGIYYPNPNDPNDDKDKTKDNEHPHGIYKDASYHHKNSKSGKSPAPNNGQELLDKAFPIEGSQDSFINLDGNNNFVVFYKTIGREFHGHIRTWNELTQFMKNTLINKGLVRRSGKIIRNIL